MVYPESAMTRRDISSEKENLVPRAHKSELASAGLGSVRTRGLMSSEQRSHAVLKESALQNQTPSSVNLSKTNIGSTEKDWLKKSLSDYSNGKQCAGSLERLREKIGQLKSVGAVKPVSQNAHRPLDTSALEHHFVGELHTRGAAPNVSDVPVHVYKDEKVSGGTQRETIKAESQRRKREMLEKRIVSIAEQARNVAELDTTSEGCDDFDKLGSLSTPSKSSSGKGNQPMQGHLPTISSGTPSMKKYSASDYFDGSRQSVHNKVGSGGYLITEKQSISTFLTEKEIKITVDQDNQGNCPLSSESALNISPSDQEVKGSRESSVERPVEIIEIQSVKFERSRYGGAMRVRRAENPKVTRGSDDHSPGSEKSTEDDQSSPGSPHAPKTSENIVNIHASAPAISEACTLSASKRANLNSSAHTVEGYLSEHRKRKAEADPSVTVTSLLLSGVDSHFSEAHEAHEAHESVSRGRSLIQRERERKRERGREIMVKETKLELDALEQSGERWNEDVAGHPPIATKGTSGTEREPWAWKTARDSRSVALPSPTLPEFSKSGKLVGGIPPRYIPPTLETRERKTEANDSPALDGVEHHAGVLKQTTEREGCEQNNGVISHSNTRAKGLGSTDDGALNHLADSFSGISIEEKSANGFSKILTQARAQTQVSGHHTAESASHTGVTGVTSLTGLSVGVSHKTALTSSHGVDLQHKPQIVLPNRERDRATELSDRSGLPKSSARVIPTAAEVPVHEVHEGHSAKSSDPPKDRGDKDQEMPPHNSQPARKTRAETENDKFVYVNGIRYQKLGKIGKGGSSEVFKVIAADCSIYALKRINLKGRDWSTAQEFYQEIKYLKGLRGKRHIIQLVDSEVINKKVLESKPEGGDTSEEACIISEEAYIYMVLEYGEIDLAGMLAVKRKEMQSNNETKLDENWLRYYWQQILEAVKTIHDERIVHSDLKPANFMLVRGELKLIDFGIAKAIQSDTTNIVKQNQNGTLNYMAPEAFLQHETDEAGVEIKIGRASDIWSLGCIFYQMVYGQTPFAELSFYPKITAITSRHHKIHYPRVSNPWLLDIMKRCLMWDRRKRLRIPELLEHPFIQPQVLLEQIYQTLARTSMSERSQVIDLILSGYDSSWGHKNGAQSGHHSPS